MLKKYQFHVEESTYCRSDLRLPVAILGKELAASEALSSDCTGGSSAHICAGGWAPGCSSVRADWHGTRRGEAVEESAERRRMEKYIMIQEIEYKTLVRKKNKYFENSI